MKQVSTGVKVELRDWRRSNKRMCITDPLILSCLALAHTQLYTYQHEFKLEEGCVCEDLGLCVGRTGTLLLFPNDTSGRKKSWTPTSQANII